MPFKLRNFHVSDIYLQDFNLYSLLLLYVEDRLLGYEQIKYTNMTKMCAECKLSWGSIFLRKFAWFYTVNFRNKSQKHRILLLPLQFCLYFIIIYLFWLLIKYILSSKLSINTDCSLMQTNIYKKTKMRNILTCIKIIN